MKSEKRERERRERLQMLRRIDPTADPAAALAKIEAQRKKRVVLLTALTLLLAAAAALTAGGMLGAGGVLPRNAAGEGSYIVSLIASIGAEKIETDVTVAEQALSQEETEELFAAAETELQTAMLGENESADYVIYDLDLPAATEDGLVEASWAFDSYQVLGSDGSISGEVPEEGTLVEVTLTMTYLTYTAESVFSVHVYPAPLSTQETLEEALSAALAQADEDTAEEEALVLPDEADGETVSWSEPQTYYGLKILLIGLLVIVILQYEEQEKIKRAALRRDAQMMEDYAGIVNKLSLLLGAGMTVFGAWEKVTDAYVRNQQEQAAQGGQRGLRLPGKDAGAGKRIAYEEMKITCRHIREGAGETRAYEAFGRRCGLRPYLKLSAILTQNLKLGTAGVTSQLSAEAQEAFEQRKSLARQKGEEAGTKLMMPMMMLLGVVLAIVVIPGFLSM